MLRRFIQRLYQLDSTVSLLDWVWFGLKLAFGLTGATVTAYATTQLSWYWETLGWAGVALAAISSFFLISLSVALLQFRRPTAAVPAPPVGEAIRPESPTPPKPETSPSPLPRGATGIATFSINWKGNQAHAASVLINVENPVGKTVVMVRFAVPIHYISESRWKWTVPMRVAEHADLLVGEKIETPYFERRADQGNGEVRAFNRVVPLTWKEPDQGEMVRLEVTVHTNDGRESFDRIWKFRTINQKWFTDCLNLDGLDYPADDEIMPLEVEGSTRTMPVQIAETGPDEPERSQNVFEVFDRVQEAWKATPHSPPAALQPMLYDRLRQGSLKCWGRPSKHYEPTLAHPWPLRVFIPKEFWETNVIEDVEHWMEHRGWRQGSPTNTITMPIKGKRNAAPCYWDLVFNPADARRLWPLKNDWMAN